MPSRSKRYAPPTSPVSAPARSARSRTPGASAAAADCAPTRAPQATPSARRRRAVISGGVHEMRGPGGPDGPSAMRTSRNAGPSRARNAGSAASSASGAVDAARPAVARRPRHLLQRDAIRDGGLAAGRGVRRVVEADVQQVARRRRRDGGERAHVHQHVAVAVEDDHAAIGLRQRDAETDRRRQAHGADHVEAGVGVARAERGARQEAVGVHTHLVAEVRHDAGEGIAQSHVR